MENRKLNETQSIELITQMIKNTQRNIVVGSGNQFIVWGVSILSASVIVTILNLFIDNHLCNFAWFIIPVIGCAWNKGVKYKEKLFTYVDKILKYIWITCGFFCVLTPVFIGISYHFNSIKLLYSIIPFIELLIVSIGVTISGLVLDTKYIVVSGFGGFIVSFMTFINIPHIIPLTYAIWAIVCVIIPGIYIRNKRLC